jgi:hypothetical protein
METDLTQERQQAHALLDTLPVEKLTAVVHLLQAISDPVARSLANVPIDDEPISEGEIHAVEASKEWLKDHAPITHEGVLAEFGLTLEDFERMDRTRLTLTAKASNEGEGDRLDRRSHVPCNRRTKASRQAVSTAEALWMNALALVPPERDPKASRI